MRRHVLVAGNWKMHGSVELVHELATHVARTFSDIKRDGFGTVCLPPAPYITLVRDRLGDAGVDVGAQDVSPERDGPFTGDVSAAMLADVGCRYVIVGHSERREYHGEDTPVLQRKIARARENGLTPIVCVGEPLPVRQRGAHAEFVGEQVQGLFQELATQGYDDWVLAYEPIWAIGTGEVALPQQAQEMCAVLRDQLGGLRAEWRERPILYGGSVKAENAADLAEQPDVDGFLVGGASLKAEAFAEIMRHAAAAIGA